MADFRAVGDTTITLEEYRALDAAGLLRRPLTDPPIRRRYRGDDTRTGDRVDLTELARSMATTRNAVEGTA